MFVSKIHGEILKFSDEIPKLSEIFFDEVYPPKFYLKKYFVFNVDLFYIDSFNTLFFNKEFKMYKTMKIYGYIITKNRTKK